MTKHNPGKLCALLVAWVALGSAPVAMAASNNAYGDIKDPYLGEALFHYFQQDVFMALSETMVALDSGRLRQNQQDATRLLAELMRAYGLHADAEQVLLKLDRDKAGAAHRDQAWLDLAVSNYRRGLYDDAQKNLRHIGKDLSDEGQDQKLFLEGQLLASRNDFKAASETFGRLSGKSDWGTYGTYNLGMALLNGGSIERGVDELNRVGRQNYGSPELRALKDQANLALGFLSLRAKDPTQAIQYLERIRLNSAHASRALLGIGWSRMMNREYENALVPLIELYNRSSGDPAVLEAYLAVPYCYAQLKANNQAIKYYEQAISAYEAQRSQLDASAQRLAEAHSLVTMLDAAAVDGPGWTAQIVGWPSSAESRVAVRVLADPWFHATVLNHHDLMQLRDKIANWSNVVDVYEQMLRKRQHGSQEAGAPSDEPADTRRATNRRTQLKSQQMVDVNIAKIADIKSRTHALKPAVDQALASHQSYLQKLLLAEIDREQAEMDRFLNQARFALAQLYEQILREGNPAP